MQVTKTIVPFLKVWSASLFNPTKAKFAYSAVTYIIERQDTEALLAAYDAELKKISADIIKHRSTMQDYHFEHSIKEAFLLGTKAKN